MWGGKTSFVCMFDVYVYNVIKMKNGAVYSISQHSRFLIYCFGMT